MSVKEEFGEAFDIYIRTKNSLIPRDEIALWAARWMAERCCQEVFAQCSSDNVAQRTAVAIRKLAKELQ